MLSCTPSRRAWVRARMRGSRRSQARARISVCPCLCSSVTASGDPPRASACPPTRQRPFGPEDPPPCGSPAHHDDTRHISRSPCRSARAGRPDSTGRRRALLVHRLRRCRRSRRPRLPPHGRCRCAALFPPLLVGPRTKRAIGRGMPTPGTYGRSHTVSSGGFIPANLLVMAAWRYWIACEDVWLCRFGNEFPDEQACRTSVCNLQRKCAGLASRCVLFMNSVHRLS